MSRKKATADKTDDMITLPSGERISREKFIRQAKMFWDLRAVTDKLNEIRKPPGLPYGAIEYARELSLIQNALNALKIDAIVKLRRGGMSVENIAATLDISYKQARKYSGQFCPETFVTGEVPPYGNL